MVYDWTKNPILPRANMVFWHQFEAGVSADGTVNDYSGNDRHYSTASNKAVLTPDVLNDQPGWYFNGSRDPMINGDGATFKHLFILASAQETTFSGFRGLFSDDSGITVLVGDDGTTKFFDNSTSITITYRKADVGFAQNNQQAPMGLAVSVIEVTAPDGLFMPALQVGKQTTFDRRWKGYWFEDIAYSEVGGDLARQRIYEYFAMRYQVWSETITGLKIYPFAANRSRSLEEDVENYLSTPYNGDPKALVRGSVEGDYELLFALREQAEYDAARAFFSQHRPVTKFAFRDYRFYPSRLAEGRCTSSIREQGSDVTYRFNFSFSMHRLGDVVSPDTLPPGEITDLSATPDGSTVTLDWTPTPDA